MDQDKHTTDSTVLEKRTKTIMKCKKYLLLSLFIFITIRAIIIFTKPKVTLIPKQESILLESGDELSNKVEDYLDLSMYDNKEIAKLIEETKLYLPDITDIGEYVITITTKNNEVKIAVIIEDTIAPTFKVEKEVLEISVVQYENFDFTTLENYEVKDISKVKVTFDDTDVDYTKVGEYKAYIIATDTSGNTKKLGITVKIEAAKILTEKNEITLTVNDTYIIKSTYNGTMKEDFTYKSDMEDIVKIDNNGKVTALKTGTATLTISYKDVKTEIKITVESKHANTPNIGSPSTGTTSESNTNSSTGSSSLIDYNNYMSSPKLSSEAITIINHYRTSANLEPLVYSSSLGTLAITRAKEIQVDFCHDGLDKYDPNFRIGEVLTMKDSRVSCMSATEAVSNWMNSTPHYNILMDKYGPSSKIAVAFINNRWVALIE